MADFDFGSLLKGIGTIMGGASLLGGNKTKTGAVSKMTKQQKEAFNLFLQHELSRLGSWIQGPKTKGNKTGMVFKWDPQAPPEYPLPRHAGLTDLQKQNTQGAWDLGNFQNQLLGQQQPNFAQSLAKYQPGNLGSVAGDFPSPPAMGSTPYQFNEYALSGGQPKRPALPDQTQYLPKDYNMPQSYIDPNAAKASGLFKGPMSMDQLTQAMQNTPLWNPAQGPVPQTGYLAPKDKGGSGSWFGNVLEGMGRDVFGSFGGNTIRGTIGRAGGGPVYPPGGTQKVNARRRAKGGPAGPGQGNYMVGEIGPELNVTQSGRRNMVGEQGPEMFSPNEPGQIVPNNQLPGMMQQGQGPQDNTGQESGGMGGGGMMGGGMGMGQGGGGDIQQILNMIALALMEPAMTLGGQGRALGGYVGPDTGDRPQDTVWANRNWSYDTGGNKWNTPGTASEIPDPGWGGQYNYGSQNWEFDPSTDPYSPAPLKNWTFQSPGVNQTGTPMWSAPNYQFPATPPPEPPPAPPAGPPPPTTLPDLPDWGGLGTPTTTQPYAEWFSYNYPDAWAAMQQNINNPQLAYDFDPNTYNQEFNQMVYDPAMKSWQDYAAPYLREQFASTGNVFGSEMPQYLTRQAGEQARQLEGQRFTGIQSGLEREATARQNMINNQQQATQTMLSMGNMPAQVLSTEAQTRRILGMLPVEVAQGMANIDLTKANIKQIYDLLPGMVDSDKADIMLKIAQGQGVVAGNLRTQMETIGVAYDNLVKAKNLAEPEANKAEQAFQDAFVDWVNALGVDFNAATTIFEQLFGVSAIEPYVTTG